MKNPMHADDVFYFTKNDLPVYFYRLVNEDGLVKNLCTNAHTTLDMVIRVTRLDGKNKGPFLLVDSLDFSNYDFDVE